MSGTMKIRFAADMPMAVVEVLSPDLDSIKQVWIRPNGEAQVAVPSEASFVRVYGPSGRTIAIPHNWNLDYVITRDMLQRAQPQRRPRRRSSATREAWFSGKLGKMIGGIFSDPVVGDPAPPIIPVPIIPVIAEWTPAAAVAQPDDEGQRFKLQPREQPYELRLRTDGTEALVRLPGTLDTASLSTDDTRGTGRVVTLRVSTRSNGADTLGAYLARANFYAANAMTDWAAEAEQMVHDKVKDPYAATVGAYLLLRLERFDLMRDWTRNLANWFEFLPDGCVIWAWQCLRQHDDAAAATEYFLKAAARGVPIYSEGLRLLTQGLIRIGEDGEGALKQLSQVTGRVVWTSPFTTTVLASEGPATTFDIGYESVL